MRHSGLIALLLLLVAACQQPQPETRLASPGIEFASLLEMQDVEHGTLFRIINPWDTSRVLMQYLLVDASDSAFSETDADGLARRYGTFQTVRTPLSRNTVCASCHCYLLQELQALDRMAVICDAEYTQLASVRERLASGACLDAGTAIAPNIEIILSARSDAIWISPFENAGLGQLSLLQIPIIYCADYMESTPLARAEWMKFYGRLVGRAAEADSLFGVVKNHYLQLAGRTESDTAHRPVLLVDLPTSATWYVPGGRSTMGRLYQDAGFRYPWADDRHAGSLSLSPEMVLEEGWGADVWLFKYYNTERDWEVPDLKALSPAFASLRVVREGKLWGCNTATSPYFDETPFRPDLLLASLRGIAAPGDSLAADTRHRYFRPL